VSSPERCVVIGAGRVGCGFVAERLLAAGMAVTLVTRTAQRAEALDRIGGARVRLVSRTGAHETLVGPLEAVPADDIGTLTRRITESSLVAVSVGGAQLPTVAPLLAPGLAAHRRRINVLAFENQPDAGPRLRAHVTALAPGRVERHGFAGVLVDRIVNTASDDPEHFVAEDRIGAALEATALRAELPAVAGFHPVAHYQAHVLRKLHVFSAGHAAAAYLGALRGYRLLGQALDDPEVRVGVLAAMAEGQAGVAATYGAAFAGGLERRLAHVARYGNCALGDTVARVGRDRARKLGRADRVLGPALRADAAGIRPVGLALVAAAALHSATERPLTDLLDRYGVPGALERVAGVPAHSAVGRLVDAAWELLSGDRSLAAARAALAADAAPALSLAS